MGHDTRDRTGKSQHEMGAKLDDGKPPVFKGFYAYFPNAVRAVSQLSATGARKYTWGGWSAVDSAEERYTDAIGRHLLDLAEDDMDLTYDCKEEGRKYFHHHLVGVAWNALAALEKAITERGITTEYIEDAPRKASK